MEILQNILKNDVFMIGFYSWIVAQAIKTILSLCKTKTFNMERLVGSGGMPSSHSAVVSAATIAVMRIRGADSVEFAIVAIIALIVMYDAMGVRRAAGEQAKVINQMVVAFMDNMHNKDQHKYDESFFHSKLKELLGHTPMEVLAGLALGIFMGIVLPIS